MKTKVTVALLIIPTLSYIINGIQNQKLEGVMNKKTIAIAILNCAIGDACFDHPINGLVEIINSDFPVRTLARMTPVELWNRCKGLSLEQARRIVTLAREEIKERELASEISRED